jgi:hypothetical protein
METKIAGIINPDDIEGFKKSLRDVIGTTANENEIKELKGEIS